MSNHRSVLNERPAILGGRPIFESKVPIVRPRLPAFFDMADELAEIMRSGMVTKGKNVAAFEAAVAEHLQVRHAVAVSSCTSGLMLSYQGLGLTGEVVVPSFTFMATVSALVWAGLRPVYADVDFETTNLDPQRAEAAVTPQTSAIVAVHNFGNPADVRGLQEVADRHGLKLVFDAAHGFGCRWQGTPVGSQGDAHSFSLSPTKLLIAGEGGVVSTNDDQLAEHVRRGREYGMGNGYDSLFAGINARMSEQNALLGLHSLRSLEAAAERRGQVAAIYHRELGTLKGIGFQRIEPTNRCSYKDFSITVDAQAFGMSRDQLAAALAAENVDTRQYYHPPVHRQTAYRRFASGQRDLPNTEALSARSLSLPIWSEMDDEIVMGICRAVIRSGQSAREVAAAAG